MASRVLFSFKLRCINKVVQYTGFRFAVMYDVNDVGEIIQGTPVKLAVVWCGFKDFL